MGKDDLKTAGLAEAAETDNAAFRRWLESASLMDDEYMTCFFGDSPECVGFLIGAVLGDPKIGVRSVRVQEPRSGSGGRGVVFDVMAVTGDGRAVDVEVQRAREPGMVRRARYYSSMMDAGMLAKGEDYRSLRDSYVLFLCGFDPFGLGLPLYSVEGACAEDPRADVADGRHIM